MKVGKGKTLPEVLPAGPVAVACPDCNAKPGQDLHDKFGRTFRHTGPDIAAAAKVDLARRP